MVELYGPAFLTAYGDSPSPIWLAAISRLTDEECKRGFVALAYKARDYPANLTQFMAACQPESPGVRFLGGQPTTPDEMRRLEPPPHRMATPQKIDGWIAKMRRTVGAVFVREPGEDG